MSAARFIVGDTRAVTASLPDGSVDLVLTSPPFLALRSYLPADHPDKPFEIGSEATPAEFLQVLLELTAEWRRVLAPHGSICVELGDTYSGSGGAGGDYNVGGLRDGQGKFDGSARRGRLASFSDDRGNPDGMRDTTFSGANTRTGGGAGWPLDKSLCGIPHLYHLSLAYGINLLSGEPSPAGRWRVRNVVAWCRPNPPVGALGDKFRPATSYMTIATVARDRYFDLDAVREAPKGGLDPAQPTGNGLYRGHPDEDKSTARPNCVSNPAGAPPLDWWEISTQPYKGAHYATWPEKLCDRPILSMVPERVCTTCAEPSRRITDAFTLDSYRSSDRPQTIKAVALADEHGLTDEHIAAVRAFGTSDAGKAITLNNGAGKNTDEVKRLACEAKAVLGGYFREFVQSTTAERTSTWTDCGHDSWRRGIVLDPFAGSGTTLKIATAHGRDAIGIDLDSRNADLASERVGMFLTVEHHTQEVVA